MTRSSVLPTADVSMYQTAFELSVIGNILIQRYDAQMLIILDANEAAARYGKWDES